MHNVQFIESYPFGIACPDTHRCLDLAVNRSSFCTVTDITAKQMFLSADLSTKLTAPNVTGRYRMNSKGPI